MHTKTTLEVRLVTRVTRVDSPETLCKSVIELVKHIVIDQSNDVDPSGLSERKKVCKDQELKQSEPKSSPQNQNGK